MLVAGLVVAALAGAGSARGAATDIVVVKPFGPLGLLDEYRVARFVRGTCFAGSSATSRRPNAWRCISGNEILDPCFLSPDRQHGFLACLATPWSKRVIGLQLTKPLPEGAANPGWPPRGLPWGIVLTSGARCVLGTGTAAIVGGAAFEYFCTGGGGAAGAPNRRTAQWTISYERRLGSSPLTTAAIRSAWF